MDVSDSEMGELLSRGDEMVAVENRKFGAKISGWRVKVRNLFTLGKLPEDGEILYEEALSKSVKC